MGFPAPEHLQTTRESILGSLSEADFVALIRLWRLRGVIAGDPLGGQRATGQWKDPGPGRINPWLVHKGVLHLNELSLVAISHLHGDHFTQ